MPFPLIHIGYYKTGSTWLQKFLFGNPASGFGSLAKDEFVRESPVWQLAGLSPFDFDAAALRGDFARLIGSVEAKGLVPVISWERLAGSPFSGGHDSALIAERLVRIFPEGKVLAVIREQRSMIVSIYKEYVKAGGVLSLVRFIASPRAKALRVPWFDLRFLEYDRLLRHYSELFGAERLLVLAYEEFVEDPTDFVAKIVRFAGLPFDAGQHDLLPFDRTVRPSPSAAWIAMRRQLNRLSVRDEVNPAPLFEAPAVQRAVRWARRDPISLVDAMLPQPLHRHWNSKLRRVAAAAVGEQYRESNSATLELTGIDLSSYGWMN